MLVVYIVQAHAGRAVQQTVMLLVVMDAVMHVVTLVVLVVMVVDVETIAVHHVLVIVT